LTTPKNRTGYLGIVILFAIFITAITGGIILHLQNQTIAAERKQKKQQLLSLQDQIKSLQNLNSIKTSETGNQPIPDASLQHSNQVVFREEVKGLAEDNNLQIIKWDSDPNTFVMKNHPEYRIAQWKLEVRGDYTGLFRFLEALPHNRQLVRLSGLKMVSVYKGLDNKGGYGYELKAQLILDLLSGITPNQD
jgi:hypothetical protein